MSEKPAQSDALGKLLKSVLIAFAFFFVVIIGVTIYLLNAIDTKTPITEEPKPGSQIEATVTPTVTAIPNPSPYKKVQKTADLKFKSVSFRLSGYPDQTAAKGVLWQNTVESLDSADIDAMLADADIDKLYYLKNKDAYYEILPGGYNEWSLVTEKYLSDRTGTKISGDETSTCVKGIEKIGWTYYTTLECRKITKDGSQVIHDVFSKQCLFEYETGKYLQYDTPLKPVGSDVDNCAILNSYGVSEITLVN